MNLSQEEFWERFEILKEKNSKGISVVTTISEWVKQKKREGTKNEWPN